VAQQDRGAGPVGILIGILFLCGLIWWMVRGTNLDNLNNTIGDLKASVQQLKEADKERAAEIEKLRETVEELRKEIAAKGPK
jgi:hypothetical protein